MEIKNAPEVDLTGGQGPRAVSVSRNRFSPKAEQNDDPNWYAIAINGVAVGLTVEGNECTSELIDRTSQASGGQNWRISENYELFSSPISQSEVISNRVRVVTRHGYVRVSADTTPTNLDFGNGAHCWNAVDGLVPASAFKIRARVFARDDTNADDIASYEFIGHFRVSTSTGLDQKGTTQPIITAIEDDTSWNAQFAVTDNSGTFGTGDVNTTTDTITDTAHGLSDNDKIYFVGSDLPAPLVQF